MAVDLAVFGGYLCGTSSYDFTFSKETPVVALISGCPNDISLSIAHNVAVILNNVMIVLVVLPT